MRTSSMRPMKPNPPLARCPILTLSGEFRCEAATVPSSAPLSSCPLRYTFIVALAAS